MAETTDSIRQTDTSKNTPDLITARDALMRLRQLAANLPPVDAAAVIRHIRDTGLDNN